MTNEAANRRYLATIIPASLVFVGASFAIKMADESAMLPTWALYAAAILPVAAMVGMFWAHWRYVSEIDEFLRSIQVKAAFAALALVMVIATGWGYLEFYAGAAALSIYWLNPLYWIAYTVAVMALNLRSGAAS
jgi:hypothetical protein